MRQKENYRQFDDERLMEMIRDLKDHEAFKQLYERYSPLVFGTCIKYLRSKYLASEITLTVFTKLYKELYTGGVTHLSAWLHAVSKNECLQEIRSEKRRKRLYDQLLNEQNESEANETPPEIDDLEKPKLKQALVQLKPRQKTCLELFYFEQKTYKEISEKLGLDLSEVKSQIQNGKRNLKVILNQSA